MDKTFTIDSGVWPRFPGMSLVCVAGTGLDNTTQRETIDGFFMDAQNDAFEMLRGVDFDDFQPTRVWRDLQPGSGFPAAHEALITRVQSRSKLRRISPFVDLYNAISIDLAARDIGAPIGAWCMNTLSGLRLLVTKGGEPFIELGKSSPAHAEPGEIAYSDLETPELITRHFVWRQSKLGAISSASRSFFLVSELVPPFDGRAEEIKDEIIDLLSRHLSVTCAATVLREGDASWTWSV